jgi:hypothetical protein
MFLELLRKALEQAKQKSRTCERTEVLPRPTLALIPIAKTRGFLVRKDITRWDTAASKTVS